jgi:hypothetical protein
MCLTSGTKATPNNNHFRSMQLLHRYGNLVHLAGIDDSVGPLRRTESDLPQFAQK